MSFLNGKDRSQSVLHLVELLCLERAPLVSPIPLLVDYQSLDDDVYVISGN